MKRVLLHCCCAPCSCSIIEFMQKNRMDPTVFFYNPNIHPAGEYEIRKNEVIRYARQMNAPFVDADYDASRWFDLTRGFENEPEKGRRCDLCFELRLSRAAEYACQNGFHIVTTSLGISRWKDFDQVTAAGIRAVKEVRSRHRGAVLKYWAYPWRKKGGSDRMAEISKRENFYRQIYCGCLYSLQQAAARRKD